MKNLVHLKNYLTKKFDLKNYQLFILRELLISDGITYDDLVVNYEDLYEDQDSTNLKAVLKDKPTKVLLKKGIIKSENDSISSNINLSQIITKALFYGFLINH